MWWFRESLYGASYLNHQAEIIQVPSVFKLRGFFFHETETSLPPCILSLDNMQRHTWLMKLHLSLSLMGGTSCLVINHKICTVSAVYVWCHVPSCHKISMRVLPIFRPCIRCEATTRSELWPYGKIQPVTWDYWPILFSRFVRHEIASLWR